MPQRQTNGNTTSISGETMAAISRILVIGGTGYIGKFMVEGSAKSGHPTFALLRESSVSNPDKAKLVQGFKDLGVNILYGDLNDNVSLVKAIKQVDVVISTVGNSLVLDQTKIISAIKEAGNVKRFLPSEFGNDVDRSRAIGHVRKEFDMKAQIRRAIEAEGIPYTYVHSNCFAGYFTASLCQCHLRLKTPPTDKVSIYGDGSVKVIINKEEDIAAYTMKAVDDPRTLNKKLFVNPPKNILSTNEIVALWEKKIGKSLEKTYILEEELLKSIEESPGLLSYLFSLNHALFIKGDLTWLGVDPSTGVEASELYPDVKYTSVDEHLDQFV
ncbi:PREDICTED: isoflavone reductase homolog P3-like [Tarenaya hassleriana]|uniref:isoflavone reductase homolog P3-like n=1 Tax=Tarenaya hassleriana TaxID=28532 RepID=UPI00053C9233|nr:PREDICTED: isoflavone reductase homolog P3-like [Tarenaya hassleriana]